MNKQIILHSYNGMQLSHKKALTKNRTKKKNKTHWYKQHHGEISAALGWVQETSLKRLHIVWAHLRDILEKAKHFCRNRKHGSGCWMLGVQGTGLMTNGHKESFGVNCSVFWFYTLRLIFTVCISYQRRY